MNKLMMKPFKHMIKVGRKQYEYVVHAKNKKEVFFECAAAGISQNFLAEDIPALLVDLPELIQMELDYKKENTQIIRFRLTKDEKKKIQQNARQHGYDTMSAYIRDLALKA